MKWIVLLPPLIVISSVILTRRMILSFLLGIAVSALIVTRGNAFQAALIAGKRLWISSGLSDISDFSSIFHSWNLMIFSFLILLGILIVVLSESGAAQAYVTLVSKYVSSKKEAESASLILSLFFFIDDYFSTLTVGSVMRPLALRFKVHPVKLAFLVTAMASPLVVLAPLSSWVGEIVLQLRQTGIDDQLTTTLIKADPFLLLVSSTPSMLYPLLLILSTWYIVLRGISYGPMKKYELKPVQGEPLRTVTEKSASMIDFLLPIVTLVGGVFFMMLYTGDYTLFGGKNDFITALKLSALAFALFFGGSASLLVSLSISYWRKSLTWYSLKLSIVKGCTMMYPSMLMLICAWALGDILKNDLKTGSYIAQNLSAIIVLELLPVICFITTTITAALLGSAWPAIGLMLPIMINMLQSLMSLKSQTPLSSVIVLIPVVGAVISGSVMGTHISVISDNPIMSAASTGADHLAHVKTMAWYVLPIGFACAAGFTLIGILIKSVGLTYSLGIGFAVGLILSIIFLELGNFLFGASFSK